MPLQDQPFASLSTQNCPLSLFGGLCKSLPLYAVCMILFPAELPDTTLGGHSRFQIFLQDSFIQGL